MKFKVGDLITGTDKALANFNDIDLSDQAVLEITSIDDDEYYCEIVSNEINDSNVGDTVCFNEREEMFFVHKQVEQATQKSVSYSWENEASQFSGVQTKNSSSGLSRAKLLKAKGLL